MGTAKRERQKANRQVRLEQMAKTAKSRKNRKRGLLIGIGLPVLVALIFLIAFLVGDDGDDTASTTVPTPSSSPVSVDPTATTLPLDPTATTVAAVTPVTVTPETLPAGETPCPAADGSSPRVIQFAAAPPMCIDTANTYTAEVTTNFGAYTMELYPDKAPLSVNNFVVLARYHYFDNTTCHRVIPDFVVQCGDPTATGSGGPGYEFANENPPAYADYIKGSLAMANSGQGTNGSQFYIASSDQTASSLEGGDAEQDGVPNYSLFGQVTNGLDTTIAAINAVGTAGAGTPSQQVVVQSVTITES